MIAIRQQTLYFDFGYIWGYIGKRGIRLNIK